MATINNIKKRAAEIKDAYEPESVTAEKVGKLFEDIADVTEQAITSSEEVMQESVRASEQAAQAAEDASGYLANLQEAIQDLPDGQAVSAEVADHELRVSDLEANSATKEEVTSKYGDYSDISEFLDAKVDAEDHFLEGIAKDGTKVFGGNVDAPNIRQLDSDVTLAKTQAQEAASTAQQASERVAGMVEDVEDAVSQAGSALQQTEQLSQDVVEKYGDYKDVSEFLEVVTDSEGKALEALHKDGTKVFFGRIKSPNIEETEQKVVQMEDSVGWFESMLSQEWAEVTLDDENHVIKGIKKDGTAYFYKLESPTLEAKVKELVTDMVGNAGKDVNLQPSAFLPAEIKSRTTDLSLPSFDDVTLTRVEINSQSDFEAAIMGQSATSATASTHLLLNLNTDVYIRTNPNIAQGNTLVINGNGHIIRGWSEYSYESDGSTQTDYRYQASSVKGSNCYCTYRGRIYGANTFISPTGEVLKLARTKCYNAASRIIASEDILDVNGDVAILANGNIPQTSNKAFKEFTTGGVTYHFNENTVYHCKFQLPTELEDLEIASVDNVFVNLTTDWMSVQAKVTKAENGWLFFDYVQQEKDYNVNQVLFTNYIGIDNDWHVVHNRTNRDFFTSFYLINYQQEDNHSCLIKTINSVDTLIFPSRYSEVGETFKPLFEFSYSGIRLKIFDATLVGYSIVKTRSGANSNDIVVLDGCTIKGCVNTAIFVRNYGSEAYVNNCEIYGCDMDGISCWYNSKLIVTNSYIHDMGARRNNSYCVVSYGSYYIAHNRIVDFGYAAIHAGIYQQDQPTKDTVTGDFTSTGTYYPCGGIIEYNTIYQTEDYFQNKAQHMVCMDAGAIYCGIHMDEMIIRHNIVYNYTGRFANRGIYLDGGCYNYYMYSNIIANVSHLAIKAYFAEDNQYYGLPYTLDNVSKYILNNYCENGIELGGRTNYPVDTGQYYIGEESPDGSGWNGQALEDNDCYLGHNIINTQMQTIDNSISGIKDTNMEEQYFINIPAYQGAFSTTLGIKEWLNKL